MTRSLIPVQALIFDMDGTLYRNARLDRLYEESIYRLIAERRRIDLVDARRLFLEHYAAMTRELGIRPSKLYTLSRLGISDLDWARKHGRLPCAEILRPDRRLRATLTTLAPWYRLGIVTNNHRANTLETLQTLGVAGFFDEVLTLSESRQYKPSSALYEQMAARLGVASESCLSLGDRYDLDLEPAAQVGMQTLLVRRMRDIYALPNVLKPVLAARYVAQTASECRLAVAAAAKVLTAGRLVVVPTDTVYGLAAAPEPQAVRWLYRAKGRPEANPLVLLLSDPDQAEAYAQISARARALMARHWPGALTLVLPVKPGTPWGRITRGGRTVALRVPDHALLRQIIRRAGGALATTSANRSGELAAASARNVDRRILAFSEAVVDAGIAPIGRPSTVAKVSGSRTLVLRQGSIRL